METREITFNIEGYRYGAYSIEDIVFKMTCTIHDDPNRPFSVDRVVPASQKDKDDLLEAEKEWSTSGSGWYDDVLTDIQGNYYVAYEGLSDENVLSEKELEWIADYCVKNQALPKALEIEGA